MGSRRNGDGSPRLLRAASRFAAWRRTHVAHSRIPKSLWAAAAKLAIEFGLSRTATRLRLNYYDLKKHVEATAPSSTRASVDNHAPAFVEWPASAFPTPGECVIELENAAGSKMRIQFKGPHGTDLVALSAAFWSTRR